MRLSVSHIAWPPDLEEEAMARLLDLGVTRLELAPLRAFGDLRSVTEGEVRKKADWYQERGFTISSFQALLFGIEDVFIFGETAHRSNMAEILKTIGRIAGWCGAGPLVFGSPKNRLKGELSEEEALEIAVPFFREVGDACAEAGSCLVIEANPEAYGADFITRLDQAAELVRLVDSNGFALHLDGGGLALSGEDFEPVIRDAANLVRHVHLSQPNLADFASPHPALERMVTALGGINYQGGVAVEMRQQPDIWDAVEKAVTWSQRQSMRIGPSPATT